MKTVDFTIITRPEFIVFTCPYCEQDVEIKYDAVDLRFDNVVRCPECGRNVELGEHDYEQAEN